MARAKPQQRLRVLVVVTTCGTVEGRFFNGIVFGGEDVGAKSGEMIFNEDALASSFDGIKSSPELFELVIKLFLCLLIQGRVKFVMIFFMYVHTLIYLVCLM